MTAFKQQQQSAVHERRSTRYQSEVVKALDREGPDWFCAGSVLAVGQEEEKIKASEAL